ncbi:hypothetical protein BDV12DRAFT_163509 [Aspergillus spectabilis]
MTVRSTPKYGLLLLSVSCAPCKGLDQGLLTTPKYQQGGLSSWHRLVTFCNPLLAAVIQAGLGIIEEAIIITLRRPDVGAVAWFGTRPISVDLSMTAGSRSSTFRARALLANIAGL